MVTASNVPSRRRGPSEALTQAMLCQACSRRAISDSRADAVADATSATRTTAPPATTRGTVQARRIEARFRIRRRSSSRRRSRQPGSTREVPRPAFDLPAPLVVVVEEDREVQGEEAERQYDGGGDSGVGKAMVTLFQDVPRS